MKLLAIPNDATSAYSRNYEEDFLSEFNPKDKKNKRTFDEVRFLNWKDKEIHTYFGITSEPFLFDKSKATKIMKELSSGSREFESPLFKEIFSKELRSTERFMKQYDPDILRSFNTHFAGELGSLIKQKYNLPLVISAHDPSRLTSIISEANSLVCISNNLAEKCTKDYNIEKSKISVIPDGIDMDWFYPRNEDKVGIDSNHRILSVGRIVPSKNIESLLKSISIFKEEFKDVKHIHLGNGTKENFNKVNKIKDKLKLNETSYFLGGKQKQELPFFYSWADVYALPTLWEGLGRAQIESLACGTPVITSNYGPMTEIVKDKHNGLTSNPKNPQEFAEKMKSYFKNKDLRKYMEENSRKSVYEEYNLKNVMEMHSNNYKRLVK